MRPIKMEIEYSPHFRKQFEKASQKVKKAFYGRLNQFIKNPFQPMLRNHKLTGKLSKYRSINITGDWRALFSESENGEKVTFEFLGTHSQLYK